MDKRSFTAAIDGHNIKTLAAAYGLSYKTMLRRITALKDLPEYQAAFKFKSRLFTPRQLDIITDELGPIPEFTGNSSG